MSRLGLLHGVQRMNLGVVMTSSPWRTVAVFEHRFGEMWPSALGRSTTVAGGTGGSLLGAARALKKFGAENGAPAPRASGPSAFGGGGRRVLPIRYWHPAWSRDQRVDGLRVARPRCQGVGCGRQRLSPPLAVEASIDQLCSTARKVSTLLFQAGAMSTLNRLSASVKGSIS